MAAWLQWKLYHYLPIECNNQNTISMKFVPIDSDASVICQQFIIASCCRPSFARHTSKRCVYTIQGAPRAMFVNRFVCGCIRFPISTVWQTGTNESLFTNNKLSTIDIIIYIFDVNRGFTESVYVHLCASGVSNASMSRTTNSSGVSKYHRIVKENECQINHHLR